MIGQHIYSRCTEGYFSKSSSTADSTTVTISKNMFSNEEQAYRVARKCESICPLEDSRPVPSNLNGIYYGVFKIKQLSKQLTLICRSYRLGADQSVSANDRGMMQRVFSYSTSYLLSGAEREKFFRNPEYLMNLQDYEPYPSIRKRIADSQNTEARGKIEANPVYSIFNHTPRTVDYTVFEKTGFTRELFAEYITSILQRIYLSKKNGVLGGKVLVVLPSRFRPDWNLTGGNAYAEALLAATLKVLPVFARHEVNAITCGGSNPEHAILDEFQLIFMESGFDSSWLKSEYSIIDLERGRSYIPEGMDLSVGEMIWDHLTDENFRQIFDNSFLDLIGAERAYMGDKRADMYSFVLHLMEEESNRYSDPMKRNQILVSFINFFAGRWTANTEELFQTILRIENEQPQHSKVLENKLLAMFTKKEYLPEKCIPDIIRCLFHYIIKDAAHDQTIRLFTELLVSNDFETEQQLLAFNKHVIQSSGAEWFENNSLKALYLNICERKEITPESEVKMTVTKILIQWYNHFSRQNDLQHCGMILNILSEQLSNPGISIPLRKEIYHNLFTLLYSGHTQGVQAAADLLQKEFPRILVQSDRYLDIYTEAMLSVLFPENGRHTVSLTPEVLDYFLNLSVMGEETYTRNTFFPAMEKLIRNYDTVYPDLVYDYSLNKLISLYQSNPIKNQRLLGMLYQLVQEFILQCPAKFQLRSGHLTQIGSLFQKNRPAYAKLLLMQMQVFTSDQDQVGYFRELSEEERRWCCLHALQTDYHNALLDTYLNRNVSRKDILTEINSAFANQTELRQKLYQLYADKMMQEYKQTDTGMISDLCRKYTAECAGIGKADSEFIQIIKNSFYAELIRCDSNQIYTLPAESLQILKNDFHLPDSNASDPNWNSIDQVLRFYSIQRPQDIVVFQNELFRRGWAASNCFAPLIGAKLEAEVKQFLSKSGAAEEPVIFKDSCYLWAILYSQIVNGYFELLTCFKSLKINSNQTKASKIACVFRMAFLSEGLADQNFIFDACQKQIHAYRETEIYCNEQLANLYRQFRSDVFQLNSFTNLPDEWREKYGLYVSGPVNGSMFMVLISLVIAIPFVIAAGLMGYFLEETILYIAGIVSLGVGFAGMLIWAIVSILSD